MALTSIVEAVAIELRGHQLSGEQKEKVDAVTVSFQTDLFVLTVQYIRTGGEP